MDTLYAYVRRHWVAFLIGGVVLCSYGFLAFRGSECFSCERTEVYKSGQQRGTSARFLHK